MQGPPILSLYQNSDMVGVVGPYLFSRTIVTLSSTRCHLGLESAFALLTDTHTFGDAHPLSWTVMSSASLAHIFPLTDLLILKYVGVTLSRCFLVYPNIPKELKPKSQ